ncbi:MAG: hypothetical protein R6W90_10460 [Ignavibacteriaceae bacterium]
MRTIIILLSVALIFVGIAAVMYVDTKSDQSKKSLITTGRAEQSDVFAKRQSMKEIDSVTALINYSFTIGNKIIPPPTDTTKVVLQQKQG